MALRATPTIAICLTAGVAAGVALARPGDQPAPAAATPAPAAEPAAADQGAGGAYGGDQPAPAAEPPIAAAAISIEGFAFSGSTAAAPGSTLEVTNLDGAAHTLTATDGAFNTGSLDGGAATAIALPTTPGTYAYFCAFHPSMTGEIVVG